MRVAKSDITNIDERAMQADLFIGDDPITVDLAYVVCPRCGGAGVHSNPSIDGNGISQEQFDDEPEFYEQYMSGAYDVTCYECAGKRVVFSINEDTLDAETRSIVQKHLAECARQDAEDAYIRRMESGNY